MWLALTFVALGQEQLVKTAHNPANDKKPFDKHDQRGLWTRNGTVEGYGGGSTCGDCGDSAR